MYKKHFLLLIISMYLTGCNNKTPYALVPKDFVENIHGQAINDPYRYVEDVKSEEVNKWISKMNDYSINMLSSIKGKNKLIKRQIQYDKGKSHRISKLKILENGMYFYLKRLSNENVAKLFYRSNFDGEEILLYDPKNFKEKEQAEYLINYIQPDWNGKQVAIGLTEKGKEISIIIVIDVIQKQVLPYTIENCWPAAAGGVQWLPDNSGFYYLHLPIIDPSSNEFLLNTQSVFYKLGNDPKKLHPVFSKKNNPSLNLKEEDAPLISISGKKNTFLIGKIAGADNYWDSYIIDINSLNKGKWKSFYQKKHKIKDYKILGDSIFFITASGAPNFRICKTSIKNPSFDSPEIIIPENKEEVIRELAITSEGLFYVTTKNGVQASLFKIDKKNKLTEIKLPKVFGDLELQTRGNKYPDLWVTATGWTTEQIRYHYNNGQLKEQNLNASKSNNYADDITIEEIEVEAYDGEKIPLSLIYNKNLKRNGSNPVLIEGYGAYGISYQPSFSLSALLWIEEGGVYAVAHVRGGGEKGDTWYKGGYKNTKENTWKDLISCSEYLIDKKVTNKSKIVIKSASAGGILIGRAITERPDLFAAAIIRAGAMNMLRSEFQPNGPNNTKEFGTIKDSLEFESLLKMDSYHHIKDNEKYPATLSIVGLNDPRVVAWDPIKFVARLQYANKSNSPTLLIADPNSGHGFDDTKTKKFEKLANTLAFALWQTGHPDYQPKE
jgi:prolyl oligopeptidase